MSDLISRQHAIDEIRFYITEPNISDDETKIEGYNDGLEMAISILSILSSAESERTAKAIKHKYSLNVVGEQTIGYEWLCDNCKKKVIDGDDYCSHCGSKLIWGDENDF